MHLGSVGRGGQGEVRQVAQGTRDNCLGLTNNQHRGLCNIVISCSPGKPVGAHATPASAQQSATAH